SEIGEFDYLGDTYGVKIITSANSGDITYCLEINDDYPKSNHEYSSLGTSSEEISKLLDISYPMISFNEMNVDNTNEAYLATQITMWAIVEDFDVNKITTNNKNTQKAIRSLYKKVKENPTSKSKYPTFTPNNKKIQDLVMVKQEVSRPDPSEELESKPNPPTPTPTPIPDPIEDNKNKDNENKVNEKTNPVKTPEKISELG
ncbi:MAG: thioester domain-containing protein, partial [Clostridium sp.]